MTVGGFASVRPSVVDSIPVPFVVAGSGNVRSLAATAFAGLRTMGFSSATSFVLAVASRTVAGLGTAGLCIAFVSSVSVTVFLRSVGSVAAILGFSPAALILVISFVVTFEIVNSVLDDIVLLASAIPCFLLAGLIAVIPVILGFSPAGLMVMTSETGTSVLESSILVTSTILSFSLERMSVVTFANLGFYPGGSIAVTSLDSGHRG